VYLSNKISPEYDLPEKPENMPRKKGPFQNPKKQEQKYHGVVLLHFFHEVFAFAASSRDKICGKKFSSEECLRGLPVHFDSFIISIISAIVRMV
jgi:hypothetical protein